MFQINCALAGKTIPGKVFETSAEAEAALAELCRVAEANNFPAEYVITDLREARSLYRDIMVKYLCLPSGPLIIDNFDRVKYVKTIKYLEVLGHMKVMFFDDERVTMILVKENEENEGV